jgi:hypothetical protein
MVLFPKLHQIIYEDNELEIVPKNSFQNLKPNAIISLKNNKIKNMQLKLKNVAHFDLSNNSISKIEDVQFTGYVYKLDLSHNQIQKWSAQNIFNSKDHGIKYLNISYNKISSVDPKMFASMSSLDLIDMGGNPFDCNDCSLQEFQTWLNSSDRKTIVTNLGAAYNTLTCTTPVSLEGIKLIEAPYNELCIENKLLITGLSVPIPLLLIILGGFIYIYRFQFLYMLHMLRVRRRVNADHGKRDKIAFEYDAFVSYSSGDRDWVHDVLMSTLENEVLGYALCLHERDFRLGGYIMDNVADCMERSRHVILVLSPKFISSQVRILVEKMLVNYSYL